MNAIPKPPTRTRRLKATSEPSRRKSSGVTFGSPRLVRRALLISIVAAVFVAGLMLDSQAVASLFWACLAGREGLVARIAAVALLLLFSAAITCVFYRPAPPPAAKARKKTTRRPVRNDTRPERTEIAETGPAEAAPPPKRRGRKASSPATERP
jgi:hypothetical protein